VLLRVAQASRLRHRVARQHLLRAMYEWLERTPDGAMRPVPRAALLRARSWSPRALGRCVRRARSDGLITSGRDGVVLTDAGRDEAARVARNHRLWEIYLITHADIAPSHVDRDADQIEHVLDPAMIRSLETQLAGATGVPASPHVLVNGGDA
jgi:manganese/zinc/iron transport system permease protein